MRTLPLAPALVGLSTLLLVPQARAAEISGARTEPVATSSANDGAADDVSITSSGSITLDAGTAITLDSSNAVTNAGSIAIGDADGAVGILAIGGVQGAILNSGSIIIDETTEADDTDDDGDYDGPFATGSSRYGVRVTGAAPFDGSITNTGVISIEGADSAAISVETDLWGHVIHSGTASVTGDRSAGLRTTGAVTGDVTVGGAVSVLGEGAVGVDIQGPVGGTVTIQNTVSATGYRSSTRPTDEDVLEALDADDLLQGGSAVSIAGDVEGGILLDTAPTDADEDVDDEDGDGVADDEEGSAYVSVAGGAPALVIGAADRDIVIGDVGVDETAYGLVVKGVVSAAGVYDGVAAEAVRIGLDGGGSVALGGGVSVSGSLTAAAYEAEAVALRLNAGAIVPSIRIDGAVSASTVSEDPFTAAAVVIESGASATSFFNAGSVSATVTGEAGDAIAVIDRSGSLSTLANTGSIVASIAATDDEDDLDDADEEEDNEAISGRTVALDLSANTTGVSLIQYGVADGDDSADGVADDDEDGDGVDDADEPVIVGDMLFGSGADDVRILNGAVVGEIAFGAGANRLHIDGGASVAGVVTADAGSLALSIGAGGLRIDNTGRLALDSLDLGAESSLILTIDPASGEFTKLDVAGSATIADGAQIGVQLTSLLEDEATYALIQAGSLASSGLDSSLLGELPYLYNAAVTVDATAGAVNLDLSRKTASELGLPASVASAYEPLVAALAMDSEVSDAVLAQTTRAEFMDVYGQLLPDHQGAVAELVSAGGRAVSRAVEDRQGPDAGGFWIQETAIAVVRDGRTDDPGYTAWSLGLVAGAETGRFPIGVVGATLAGASGKVEGEDAVAGDNMIVNTVELGGYWRLVEGPLALNARAGAGWLGVTNDRATAVFDADDERILFRSAKGEWSGATLTGRVSAGYEFRHGRYYLRPIASLDYFWLREDGYTESGGREAIDLDVEARTSHRIDGFLGVAGGARFGQENWWGPEVQAGWRTISGENGQTIGRFVSGTDDFTLLADEVTGSGAVFRGAIKGEDVGAAFALEGGAEMRDDIAVYDLRLAAHFRF
jgi:hypothetical protein